MTDLLSDPELYAQACKIYGFAAPPDPVTLARRQVEILTNVAQVIVDRPKVQQLISMNAVTVSEIGELWVQAVGRKYPPGVLVRPESATIKGLWQGSTLRGLEILLRGPDERTILTTIEFHQPPKEAT